MKSDSANVQKYIDSTPVCKTKRQTTIQFFSKPSSSSASLKTSPSSSSSNCTPQQVEEIDITKSNEPNINRAFVDKVSNIDQNKRFLLNDFLSAVLGTESDNVSQDLCIFQEIVHLQILISVPTKWKTFNALYGKYVSQNIYNRQTNLSNKLHQIEREKETLKSLYVKTASINISAALGIEILSKNANNKKQAYLDCVKGLTTFQSLIDDSELRNNLRRRLSQQQKVISQKQALEYDDYDNLS